MVADTPAKVIERYASLRSAGIIQKDFMMWSGPSRSTLLYTGSP